MMYQLWHTCEQVNKWTQMILAAAPEICGCELAPEEDRKGLSHCLLNLANRKWTCGSNLFSTFAPSKRNHRSCGTMNRQVINIFTLILLALASYQSASGEHQNHRQHNQQVSGREFNLGESIKLSTVREAQIEAFLRDKQYQLIDSDKRDEENEKISNFSSERKQQQLLLPPQPSMKSNLIDGEFNEAAALYQSSSQDLDNKIREERDKQSSRQDQQQFQLSPSKQAGRGLADGAETNIQREQQDNINGNPKGLFRFRRGIQWDEQLTSSSSGCRHCQGHAVVKRSAWKGGQRYRKSGDSTQAINSGIADQVDCKTLSPFWHFLRSSYPALATHLLMLSSEQADGGPKFVSSLSFNSKTIVHLLEQADRILSEQQHQQSASWITSNDIYNDNFLGPKDSANQRQPSNWLSRVSTNPNYAKLLNKLRHHYNNRLHASTNTNFLSTIAELESNPKVASTLNPSTTQATQTTPEANDRTVYGRIIHYPNDMVESGGSKAIDRLHKLSEFVREPSQTQRELDENEVVESNKIHLLLDSTTATTNTDSASSRGRNKDYVFGSVLHEPSQKSGTEELDSVNQHHRHSSMSTLRHLNRQQGNLVGESNSNNNNNNQEESYGRILLSPSNNFQQQQTNSEANLHISHQQTNSLPFRGGNNKPSTLHVLKQQLEPATNLNRINNIPLDGGGYPEEFSVNSPNNHEPQTGDDFEGIFMSRPFEHAKVSLDARTTDGDRESKIGESSSAVKNSHNDFSVE